VRSYEKWGELLGYLSFAFAKQAISSQAFPGGKEGSTTRLSNLEQVNNPRAPHILRTLKVKI
jgi:hypothetical protein